MYAVFQMNQAHKCSDKVFIVPPRDGGKAAKERWPWSRDVGSSGARCVDPKADIRAPN